MFDRWPGAPTPALVAAAVDPFEVRTAVGGEEKKGRCDGKWGGRCGQVDRRRKVTYKIYMVP